MDGSMGLCVGMILTGVVLLGATLSSLARRRMADSFVLTWGLISMIMILAGLFLHPAELNRYISAMGMLLVASVGFCMVYGTYYMSIRVSELMRRNLELTMQVTLLWQELETLETSVEERISEEGALWNEEGAGGYQHAGAGRSGDRAAGAAPAHGPKAV